MNEKKKIIQYGITAVFGIGAILAVLVFSGKLSFGKGGEEVIAGNITVWGTLPAGAMNRVLETLPNTHQDLKVSYVQKDPRTYQNEILEALSAGGGPDLLIFPPEDLWKNSVRLYPIPYEKYPDTVFKQNFIDQAERNMGTPGIYGFPLVVDPLILYYNRDILSSAFYSEPPKDWDELSARVPQLTQKTDSGEIIQSAIALGAFGNIRNAKDIVALLFLQAGTPITSKNQFDNRITSVVGISTTNRAEELPAVRALDFYRRFAVPTELNYTWNPGLQSDQFQFISGRLAHYIGFASEYNDIRTKNPNLNFDVTFVPQRASSTTRITYGKLYSIGISKISKKKNLAVAFVYWITDAEPLLKLSQELGLPPSRKSLLSQRPRDDARTALSYNAAIASRGWIDPDGAQTSLLFQELIQGVVTGGQARIPEALQIFHSKLERLFQ